MSCEVLSHPGSFSFAPCRFTGWCLNRSSDWTRIWGSVPALPKKCVSKFYARRQAGTRGCPKIFRLFGSIFRPVHRRGVVAHRAVPFVHRFSTFRGSDRWSRYAATRLLDQREGRRLDEGTSDRRELHRFDERASDRGQSSSDSAWMSTPARPPTTVPLIRMNWRSRPTCNSIRSAVSWPSQRFTVAEMTVAMLGP